MCVVWQNLSFIILGIGALFAAFFHLGTSEGQHPRAGDEADGEQSPLLPSSNTSSHFLQWKCWLKQPSFYQVSLLRPNTLLFSWSDFGWESVFMQLSFSFETAQHQVLLCVSAGGLTLYVHQVNRESLSDLHLHVSHQHAGAAQGKTSQISIFQWNFRSELWRSWNLMIKVTLSRIKTKTAKRSNLKPVPKTSKVINEIKSKSVTKT